MLGEGLDLTRQQIIESTRRRADLSGLDDPDVRAYRAAVNERVVEMAEVSTGDRVLDIGTGAQGCSKAVQQAGGLFYGLDLAAASLANHPGKATSIVADAVHIPYGDDVYDKVFAVMAFHDVADTASLVTEITRVLRTGGDIILAENGITRWVFDLLLYGLYCAELSSKRLPIVSEKRLGEVESFFRTRDLDAVSFANLFLRDAIGSDLESLADLFAQMVGNMKSRRATKSALNHLYTAFQVVFFDYCETLLVAGGLAPIKKGMIVACQSRDSGEILNCSIADNADPLSSIYKQARINSSSNVIDRAQRQSGADIYIPVGIYKKVI